MSDAAAQEAVPSPRRFRFAKLIAPVARVVILGFLPCPDLVARCRMRRAAYRLITLKTWPGMAATSDQAAQLAMLRLLWLQRQTRRAIRGRHGEAAVMLARSGVEALLLGMYCLRVPGAIGKLHSDNLKALGDGLAYMEETGIGRAQVIRECIAKLGTLSNKYLSVWSMAQAIDEANGSSAARSLYRRLYVPLSNYTVHANGGTLLRHVGHDDRLRHRPSHSWARRSPARVADATVGLLAADLARYEGVPNQDLLRYANRHIERTLLPMAVTAFTGLRGRPRHRQVGKMLRQARGIYRYLWTGPAAADSIEARVAYLRERLAVFP